MLGNTILDLLDRAYQEKNAEGLEKLLWAVENDGVGTEYTGILCDLLVETWHEQHEDILMMLEDIKDPESVDAIVKSLELKLDYYTGNDIPRKAIWALTAIRTPKAVQELQKLAKSTDEFTREHAIVNLNSIT